MRPIYLDHHATTPCDDAVLAEMLPYFRSAFGNSSSRTHAYGAEADLAVKKATRQVARLAGCGARDVVWTSGATEANNLAVFGMATAAGPGHIISTEIEHKAVLDPLGELRRRGYEVSLVPVGPDGVVEPATIRACLRSDTRLISVMLANNEIGTVQPTREIGRIAKAAGIPLHVDASQAPGYCDVDLTTVGADLMSLSAHKMYGPKGVGVLVVSPELRRGPDPQIVGGGHQRNRRSGTLPVPLLVGMGAAAELAKDGLNSGESERVSALRDRLLDGLRRSCAVVQVNGCLERRLPNNLNVSLGVDAEALMLRLQGLLALSSGSACTSATIAPSHVLVAIGCDAERSFSALRFGLGHSTTEREIDAAVQAIARTVVALQEFA